MTVGRLEQEMGAGELAEWVELLSSGEPWGEYREDRLWLDQVGFTIMAPNHQDPAKLLRELRLPWDRGKKQEARTISPGEWVSKLVAWGGKVGTGNA